MEKPQPTCSINTRSKSSSDLSCRRPFSAPLRRARSLQLAGKNETSRSQSSSAALPVSTQPTLKLPGQQVNKQVNAYELVLAPDVARIQSGATIWRVASSGKTTS